VIHSQSFDRDKFHVVTMISNPARFERRYELYKKFARHMEEHRVNLWTVELQLGDRPFAITSADNPRHIQLRHWDELWHKENALNVGISRLPHDWETVAWIDADVEFVRKDWVKETLNQLQVYQVVQMFETAVDLGPTGQTMAVHKSLISEYIRKCAVHPNRPYHEQHPGFCWAARREAIDAMGGLFDKAILGAGDRHMALAFLGKAHMSFHSKTSSEYQKAIMDFQEKCERSIRRDVGFVPGTIIHSWHGKKADRQYGGRWQILVNNQFRPNHHIKRNSYGIYQWHDDGSHNFLRLRDEIRHYFRSRSEDSIDMI
jgi:hypothetical protein